MTITSLPLMFELHSLFFEEKAAEEFLLERVYYKQRACEACSRAMVKRESRKVFECRRCKLTISWRSGSFFFNVKSPVNKVLLAGYLWLSKAPTQSVIAQTGMSSKTVGKLFGYFRQLVSDAVDVADVRIGGPGIVVEVNESKFGKRKYNRATVLRAFGPSAEWKEHRRKKCF